MFYISEFCIGSSNFMFADDIEREFKEALEREGSEEYNEKIDY